MYLSLFHLSDYTGENRGPQADEIFDIFNFEGEQALKIKDMSGSGPSNLHLDPSTGIRSQLFKAGAHAGVFSALEMEVKYQNRRVSMLSPNKPSIPTACPLIAAENRYLRQSRAG